MRDAAAEYLGMFAGLAGFFLVIRDFDGLQFEAAPVLAAAGLTLAVLWAGRACRRWLFWLLWLAGAACLARYGWTHWEAFLPEAEELAGWFLGTGTEGIPVTGIMTAAAVVLAFLTALLEAAGLHFLFCLLLPGALLFPPLVGGAPTLLQLLLLLGSAVSLWAIRVAKNGRRAYPKPTERSRIGRQGAFSVLAVMLAALLIGLPLSDALTPGVTDLDIQVRDRVNDWVEERYPTDQGTINKGDNPYSDRAMMQLFATRTPESVLYLKNYIGGDYYRSRFSEADESVLTRLAIEEGILAEEDWLSPEGFYYSLRSAMPDRDELHRNGLVVQNYGARGRSRPYASLALEQEKGYDEDGVVLPVALSGYPFVYLEEDSRGSVADVLDVIDGYGTLWKRYQVYCRADYTAYPEKELSRLAALVAEEPLTDLDEITSFIIATLDAHAVYTRTPGSAPFNKDIIEWFLFDSGKGYCQQYAATAAMMYRMYGIPARYVAGYRVDPASFFSLGLSSAYNLAVASVTDRSAHAWVEIWLEDCGWTPVEVTPDENGYFHPVYPGFGEETLQEIREEHGWTESLAAKDRPAEEPEEPEKPAEDGDEEPAEEPEDPEEPEEPAPEKDGEDTPEKPQDEEPEGGEAQPDAADELRAIGLWAARILGAAAALLLLVFGTWKRSRCRAARLEKMDAVAVWRRIAAMTRAAGLLPGEDPEGRGFPALAAEAAGGGEDLAVRLEKARETALCRAFSEKGPAPEAEEEAREACRAYGAALYEGLSPLRKFLFRWIYAFV